MKFVLLIVLRLLTIANSFLLNIGEHINFSTNTNTFISGEISCLDELSTKKKFYNPEAGSFFVLLYVLFFLSAFRIK